MTLHDVIQYALNNGMNRDKIIELIDENEAALGRVTDLKAELSQHEFEDYKLAIDCIAESK